MNESLLCHECDADAVGQCRVCGRGFCGGHGSDLCRGCATAIVAADPRTGQAPKQAYLQCVSRPRLKTIYLDDDGPPECFCCQAYARFICQSCHNLYCADHGGANQWCDSCNRQKSSIVPLVILGFFVWLVVCLGILNWFQWW